MHKYLVTGLDSTFYEGDDYGAALSKFNHAVQDFKDDAEKIEGREYYDLNNSEKDIYNAQNSAYQAIELLELNDDEEYEAVETFYYNSTI